LGVVLQAEKLQNLSSVSHSLLQRSYILTLLIVVYLAAPILLLFWIIGFAWKRTLPKRAHEIDLDTGRKSWLTVEDMRAYRAERRKAPLYTESSSRIASRVIIKGKAFVVKVRGPADMLVHAKIVSRYQYATW
jgi:amino acid permease